MDERVEASEVAGKLVAASAYYWVVVGTLEVAEHPMVASLVWVAER